VAFGIPRNITLNMRIKKSKTREVKKNRKTDDICLDDEIVALRVIKII
jgi:hypothetical protein